MRVRYLLRVLFALAAVSATSCSSCRRELVVSDAVYREAVTAFHTGLAALETSQDGLALQKLQRVTEIVPAEPAAWADLGLLYLRHQELDLAAQHLARAAALAPKNADILRLQGLTESRRGNLAEAIRIWKRSVELNTGDVRSAFAIAEETERQGGPVNEAEAERQLGTLLQQSDNVAVRIEYARLVAKRGDAALLSQTIAPLTKAAAAWSTEARAQLQTLQAAAAADPRSAALQAVFLKNVLLAVPSYRQALGRVSTPDDAAGEPIDHFLALKNPDPQPAPADTSLTFTVSLDADASSTNVAWTRAFSLRGEGAPIIASGGTAGLRVGKQIVGPNIAAVIAPGSHSVAADINYDFRTDLIVAGAAGIAIFRQDEAGRFKVVTAAAHIPDAIRTAPASGVWSADIDLDGDLDLVIAPTNGQLVVLRNNTDGTFTPQFPFQGVSGVRGFVWADFDDETAPDAAMLDANGIVHLFRNMRGGSFKKQPLPNTISNGVAIAAGDIGHAAAFDLLVLRTDGAVSRIAPDTWEASSIARLDGMTDTLAAGSAQLIVADLDNNGAADLIIGGTGKTGVLLCGSDGTFAPAGVMLTLGVHDVADLDGDGRLDLIGLDQARHVARAINRGTAPYHWQVLRPRAADAHGDQRINSFGVGGSIEVRSGLHLQKQVITSPFVHFGLGAAAGTDVVRITWPNGVLQSDFDQKADATLVADQRLKGSCPWLFAWNGSAMAFVTDVIWRSPLGLRINAQATADIVTTEDRVKVPGSALAPRDGAYDLRITAELWETHFFDLVSLMAVDHPAGTEVFVDERFAIPAPSLTPVATGPVQPFRTARDDQGRDVSNVVETRDDRHLDFAGRGDYQGITRDHFVELELPDDAPRMGSLYLVAQGWIHPTDSSVNVAISQGAHPAPRGLSLQVADRAGRFREVKANLGFPAGKDKTVLLDLAGLFPSAGPRRVRLATNLEIFWDRLGWAVARPDVRLATQQITLSSAELRYRGFSPTGRSNATAPERPRYELAGTAPRWLDLEGYYTRYGDVRPLLTGVDDRYVIMNAGDELRLRFAEAAPPAQGMTRDFIVVGDGWVKDGDYNTTFSRTVLPLPSHANARYDTPPRRLQDDPVYLQHRQDFEDYHTRFVDGSAARAALGGGAGRRR